MPTPEEIFVEEAHRAIPSKFFGAYWTRSDPAVVGQVTERFTDRIFSLDPDEVNHFFDEYNPTTSSVTSQYAFLMSVFLPGYKDLETYDRMYIATCESMLDNPFLPTFQRIAKQRREK